MDDEIDVFGCESTDGAQVLLTTNHLVFGLGSFTRRDGKVTLSICDIADVTKHHSMISNTVLITTRLSQEFKLKFKSKSIAQTLYQLLQFRLLQTKKSIRTSFATSVQEFEIPFDDLEIGDEIGTGSYGHVNRATWNGLVVAVKSVRLESLKDFQNFQREVSCLISLRHPSCIQCYGVAMDDELGKQNPKIVMEYCAGGSLFDAIKQEKACLYRWEYLLRLFYDISRGMQYVHGRGVVHRDLKADNIMLLSNDNMITKDSSVAKIVDFGISRFLSSKSSEANKTLCGTPGNFAPEIFSQEYSFPCDVFSFGVTMYKTIFKTDPFPNIVHIIDYKKLIEEQFKPVFVFPIPLLVQDILNECLSYDPTLRPTFTQITHFLRNCMLRWKIDPTTFPAIPNGQKEEQNEKIVPPVTEFSDLLVLKTPPGLSRLRKSRKYSSDMMRPAGFSPQVQQKETNEELCNTKCNLSFLP